MDYQWDVLQPHIMSLRVGPEHIDVLGHVNNCEYLKWMEDVAWDHCQHLNMTYEKWQELGYAWVARHTEIDYFLPAFENEELLAATWVSENDKKVSMKRSYEIKRASDGKTLIRGFTKWICINLKSGKAARMPKEFVDGFDLKFKANEQKTR